MAGRPALDSVQVICKMFEWCINNSEGRDEANESEQKKSEAGVEKRTKSAFWFGGEECEKKGQFGLVLFWREGGKTWGMFGPEKGTTGEGEMKYSLGADKYKKDGVNPAGIGSGWDGAGRYI